jgi:glycosyltransferase involved in cell wall biosynthesis
VQRGVHIPDHFRAGDVAVVSGNLRILSNYPLILSARRRGLGVVWWGQGWSATSTRLGALVRHQLMRRLADICLVYTERERDVLLALGFAAERVFFTNNTIDETEIDAAMAHWSTAKLAAFAADHGLAERDILLFCGRLTAKSQIALAIRALAQARRQHPQILLVVIGDGELMPALRAEIDAHGLGPWVRLLGAIQDEARLAPWFMLARGLIYPGAIGLSLNHAFAYGLPVLTHDNARRHMPEFAALRPGENGLVFPEGDAAGLAARMIELLTAPDRRAALSAEAFATVRGEYSIGRMADNFVAAINAASRHALARRVRA